MPNRSARRSQAGFTLIEMLIVVGIIGILSAISLPQILNYMHHFRIRGATSEIAGAVQQARVRAVTKSAEWGVLFAVGDPNAGANANRIYWIHVEDDQTLPRQGAAQVLNIATPDLAQTTRMELPPLIVFANAAQCTPNPALVPVFAPTNNSVRFNRLGAACFPGVAPCAQPPAPAAITTNFIQSVNGGAAAVICLRDTRSGVSRWVRIDRGGRVEVQR